MWKKNFERISREFAWQNVSVAALFFRVLVFSFPLSAALHSSLCWEAHRILDVYLIGAITDEEVWLSQAVQGIIEAGSN